MKKIKIYTETGIYQYAKGFKDVKDISLPDQPLLVKIEKEDGTIIIYEGFKYIYEYDKEL